MGLQLVSADNLHEDGITYRIRRDNLEQDFTIEEKHDGWRLGGLRPGSGIHGFELRRVQAPRVTGQEGDGR